MGLVVSYDEKLGVPHSEIALTSGEHIFIALSRDELKITLLARPGAAGRVLFRADPASAAKICDGLFDIKPNDKTSPLKMLVAVAAQLPDSAAVETAFKNAAKA